MIIIACSFAFTAIAAVTPPVARVDDAVTEHHGVTIHDPYRWLEDTASAESAAWLSGQGAHTRTQLDRIAALPTLRKRVSDLDAMVTRRVWAPQRAGERLFTLERGPEDALGKLFMRTSSRFETISPMEKPRLLFDPDEAIAAGGARQAINNYAASPDGARVAMLTGAADGEVCVLRVRDTATGKDIGPAIDGIWGELTPSWRDDGSALFYTRKNVAGTPFDAKDMFGKLRIYERKLGDDGAPRANTADVPVFGFNVAGAPAAREKDWPFLATTKNSPWAVGMLAEGVSSPLRLFAVDKNQLGRPDASWRQITEEQDGVRDYTHYGRWVFVKTFVDAPRFRVLRYDLANLAAPPVIIMRQQDGVIEQIAAAADGLYVVVRTGAVAELMLLPYDNRETDQRVDLPYAGAVALSFASPDHRGALFQLRAWTQMTQLYEAKWQPSPKGAIMHELVAHNTGLIPSVPALATLTSTLTSQETLCTSHDGAKVPMSIIGPKKRKRGAPVLMYGYGGYGFTSTASFDPTMLAWYEQGGVFAVVNPRGSGAFGEEWYRAGVGANKANTWKDMIACAETLVSTKVASPDRLAIWGVSMGGVAVGRAVTERPELFRSALMQVGILDAIRFIEASPNGPNHEIEMGTLQSKAGVDQLLAMSAYHHVKDGAPYPAVLVIHGLHDNRVEPWCSFKMTARLQAATATVPSASKRSVLLRLDDDAGHGVTMTSQQKNAQWADAIAFLLWNAGVRGFQPL